MKHPHFPWSFVPGGREPLDGVVQREEAPLLQTRGGRWSLVT